MFWQKITPKKEEELKLRAKLSNLEISDFYIYFANIAKIFIEEYGFKKSIEAALPFDQNGSPLPLYTYPAIEYLNSLDLKNKRIFEFGCGNSTLYFLQKEAIVTSVENNQIWFEKLSNEINKNQNHKLIFAKKEEYINSILGEEGKFDIIVIDGSENRLKSTANALKKIKEDGVIIVDNSDWFENSTKLIRDSLDFIQIDFYGFRPSKSNTSVTSLFLSRKVNLKTITPKQPNFAIGGVKRHSNNDLD